MPCGTCRTAGDPGYGGIQYANNRYFLENEGGNSSGGTTVDGPEVDNDWTLAAFYVRDLESDYSRENNSQYQNAVACNGCPISNSYNDGGSNGKGLFNFHGEQYKTLYDFNKDNLFATQRMHVINQRKNLSWENYTNSQLGGPRVRYIVDPVNPKAVIDLRHMLIVGKYGRVIGNFLEVLQFILGQASGGDIQDYYSNELGYDFYNKYGKLIEENPNEFVNYLNEYLTNPIIRNK